jgi:two-component system response regulator MprA
MGTHRILVVEDDHGLRDLLARGLRSQDFDVVTAVDGESALKSVAVAPDAIVLDIGLPDSDGRDVCQALRSRGVDAPVIFLTARRDVPDRLSGFASGGDDYLPKPFAFPELVARLRALLRRHVQVAQDGADVRLRVDPIGHCVYWNGVRADLTPIEYKLLARLIAEPDAVVRRQQLREAAWPAGAIVSDNTLDQYLSRLRRKLVEIGSTQVIRSARGIGYQVVPGE